MKLTALAFLAIGCHSRPAPNRPRSPEERATVALAAWTTALAHDDRRALESAEDRAGQFAVVYAATKLGASHFDGGAESVEGVVVRFLLCGEVAAGWFLVWGERAGAL